MKGRLEHRLQQTNVRTFSRSPDALHGQHLGPTYTRRFQRASTVKTLEHAAKAALSVGETVRNIASSVVVLSSFSQQQMVSQLCRSFRKDRRHVF